MALHTQSSTPIDVAEIRQIKGHLIAVHPGGDFALRGSLSLAQAKAAHAAEGKLDAEVTDPAAGRVAPEGRGRRSGAPVPAEKGEEQEGGEQWDPEHGDRPPP